MPESTSDDVGSSLVWASDQVRADIEKQVRPGLSVPRLAVRAAVSCFVVTGPLAWLVFVVITLAAPAVTDDAGIGAVGLWALWFAALLTVLTLVVSLRQLSAKADDDTAEPPSRWSMVRRLGMSMLPTGACAAVVLAFAGLAVGQIAVLTGALIVVLHLVPALVAQLPARRSRRRRDSA